MPTQWDKNQLVALEIKFFVSRLLNTDCNRAVYHIVGFIMRILISHLAQFTVLKSVLFL